MAEIGYGYGSEYQLMRFLGHHREELDKTIKEHIGVEAALLAPTAVNQQKFSFEYLGMKDNRHQIRAKKGFSMIGFTQMDLGIAKCHFEIGAGNIKLKWA